MKGTNDIRRGGSYSTWRDCVKEDPPERLARTILGSPWGANFGKTVGFSHLKGGPARKNWWGFSERVENLEKGSRNLTHEDGPICAEGQGGKRQCEQNFHKKPE